MEKHIQRTSILWTGVGVTVLHLTCYSSSPFIHPPVSQCSFTGGLLATKHFSDVIFFHSHCFIQSDLDYKPLKNNAGRIRRSSYHMNLPHDFALYLELIISAKLLDFINCYLVRAHCTHFHAGQKIFPLLS